MTIPAARPSTSSGHRHAERKQRARATEIAFLARVDEVQTFILSGMENHKIVQIISEKHGIGERQTRNYIRKVRARLEEFSEKMRPGMFAEHIAVRRNLRLKALSEKNYQLALQIVQDEARLWGLYAPTKIAPTTPDGNNEWSGKSDSELIAEFERLLENAKTLTTGKPGQGDSPPVQSELDADSPHSSPAPD